MSHVACLVKQSQDAKWHEYNAHQLPVGPLCYRCGDGVGRVRPGMTTEQAMSLKNDAAKRKEEDPTFLTDVATAVKVMDGVEEPSVNPTSSVFQE